MEKSAWCANETLCKTRGEITCPLNACSQLSGSGDLCTVVIISSLYDYISRKARGLPRILVTVPVHADGDILVAARFMRALDVVDFTGWFSV
jgi:hypothetical protein